MFVPPHSALNPPNLFSFCFLGLLLFLSFLCFVMQKKLFSPSKRALFSGCRKRSAAKGVRSLSFVFGTLSVTFRSLFLTLLSLFSSLFCRTPFAGLLLQQGDICLFLNVSLCFSLAFCGLPLFQFFFLSLSPRQVPRPIPFPTQTGLKVRLA